VAHHVGHLDWSFADAPTTPSATAEGLARQVLIGPAQGAAHTELAAGWLLAGGWLARHVHSFEEALYVLGGELLLELDRTVHRLVAGDYALVPIGLHHTLAAGDDTPVRWLSVNTPPRRPRDAPVPDTIFASQPPDVAALAALAEHPRFGDPAVRHVGHYEGTPPQAEALAIKDPARGRAPVGMDTAILAYSGISVKMLVDRTLGADHLTVFTVDYEKGGTSSWPARSRPNSRERPIALVPATSPSPALARRTASGTSAMAAFAGSRPRRPSRRPEMHTAGRAPGHGSPNAEWRRGRVQPRIERLSDGETDGKR
jgi:quercetin dioxygenase-like cupin family protein